MLGKIRNKLQALFDARRWTLHNVRQGKCSEENFAAIFLLIGDVGDGPERLLLTVDLLHLCYHLAHYPKAIDEEPEIVVMGTLAFSDIDVANQLVEKPL